MSKQKSTEHVRDLGRACLSCEFGHFVEETPFTGECRRSPPRSFLQTKDGNPGRFFTTVKHNDWCGQYKLSPDTSRVEKNLLKMAPFQSLGKRIELADALRHAGKNNDAALIYEGVFEQTASDAGLAFKIGGCYWDEMMSGADRDPTLAAIALGWQRKAFDLGHPEVCYLLARNYPLTASKPLIKPKVFFHGRIKPRPRGPRASGRLPGLLYAISG